MKNIIVNTFASRNSGALSIYLQFIAHLPKFSNENNYYIFVDPTMEQPPIAGVFYIIDSDHSFCHRIAWEHGGLNQWLKKRHIKPDVIVSLQNTGTSTKCKQVIYYHQPLPFYQRKWSFFKAEERLMWLYKHIYPLFVKSTINKRTHVVVQIPFIKREFIKKFKIDSERIYVLFPDLEKIDISAVEPFCEKDSYVHFLYPATALPYKEHITIVKAIATLHSKSPHLSDKIRIHFTLFAKDHPKIYTMIKKMGVEKYFIMNGHIAHNKLLSLYKSVDGLLFPSTIETLGLPLLEAAAFGLPIVASDLDYAHEVLDGYKGVVYANSSDYNLWAEKIEQTYLHPQKYEPLLPNHSSWKEFFKLIEK